MGGRMDLLLKDGPSWVVGEIKSTTRNLDSIAAGDRPDHYAQAKFYAYILLTQNPGLKNIAIRLIYCDLEAENIRSFDEEYTFGELESFVVETLKAYIEWAIILIKSQQKKLKTARELAFPFGQFRSFQRELSATVYTCIRENKNLLLRAPTGIGKTMATVFPSLKAIANPEQKIFYLTAKTIGRTVAQKAFEICMDCGLEAKVTTITAKEKTCFLDEARCDPEFCPYAKGFFNRQKDAMKDLFQSENLYSREVIEKYAKKHKICPFEFSLSMASISDCVICDYNYLFDPRAFLRRFFEEPSEHIALIDEAHNLYDRACEMFSASLSKDSILEIKRHFRQHPAISKSLNALNSLFTGYRKELEDENIQYKFTDELDKNLLNKVKHTQATLERFLQKNYNTEERSKLLNFYFDLLQFQRISEYYIESFKFHTEVNGKNLTASIVCLNPGIHLANRLKNVKSAILFSATLHPLDYFQAILLADEQAEQLFLPSPFDRDNLDLTVNYGLSTKYNDRLYTSSLIARQIYNFTQQKKGNYLIFFPSYAYMEQIFGIYCSLAGDNQSLAMQEKAMDEQMREEFLKRFEAGSENPVVAFAVLGGIFSEGIDLIGDFLIGSVIVGVGLPQLNPLLEQRRRYFEKTMDAGYRYAYIVPGFNKVMQAVGRVIRSDDDKGSVLLIDTRYAQRDYLDLFPFEWQHAKFVK